MALADKFDDKAAPLAMLDAEAYRALLEKLVVEGQGLGKTKSVGGFFMQDIDVETLTSKGERMPWARILSLRVQPAPRRRTIREPVQRDSLKGDARIMRASLSRLIRIACA